MNNLLTKLERLVDVMTAYYEKAENPVVEAKTKVIETPAEVVAEEPKAKRGRKPKAEVPAAPPAADPFGFQDAPAAPAAPEMPAMTEAQSLTKARDLALAWIKAKFVSQAEGVAAFTQRVQKEYKVAKFDQLSHDQRLDLIAKFTAEGVVA